MGRALIAGMTDYSHQSIDDIVEDLETWIKSLQETKELFHNIIEKLQNSGYWDNNVIYDFQAHIGYALKFYETSEKELNEILKDIQADEVQQNHVTRLRSMAKTARELNIQYGQVWHKEYKQKDYGNPDFKLVERLYASGRDMAADMLDLSNLAVRLKDFIGRKGKAILSDKAEKKENVSKVLGLYIDLGRIKELAAISSTRFDLQKLIRLCEELNQCYANECFLSVAMLTRAILDHIPPIFNCNSFSEIVNNYRGSKSFKQSMQNLENSSRKIADAHLHVQIRDKETLPNKTQVNFSNDVDVLLAEIVRILK